MIRPMLAAAQDPVSWLLSNPKLLLIVFPLAVWFINQVLAATRARQAGQPGQPAESAANGDDAEAERTRRVQEEVRRKIAERRGERPPAPAAPPRIDRPPPTLLETRQSARDDVQPRAAWQPAAQAPVPPAPAPSSFPATQSPAVAALLLELHDPPQVRRAIILREVLGPPVALR